MGPVQVSIEFKILPALHTLHQKNIITQVQELRTQVRETTTEEDYYYQKKLSSQAVNFSN